MLINPAYLGSMGEGGASWLNGPSLKNWGMEFALGYRHTTDYGFRYNVNGNLDFYRSKVTYLPETTTGSYVHTSKENLVESKRPYGSIVGYVVDGLFQNREEVLASGQENARVGGLKYADLDGNGVISYYGDFIEESDGMLYSNTSYMPRYSAVYTYRDANLYEFEDELDTQTYNKLDGGLPPWDTGRKSVWLLPADECNTGKIHYIGTRSDVVDDTEDLWVDSSGRVYAVDYDTGVAYKLSMSCSKHCGFRYNKGIRFEDGGSMPFWPF